MSRPILILLLVFGSEASQLDKLINFARGTGPNPGFDGAAAPAPSPRHVTAPKRTVPVAAVPSDRSVEVAPKFAAPIKIPRLPAGAVQVSGGRNHATRVSADRRRLQPTRRLVASVPTTCRDCVPRNRPPTILRAIKVPSRVAPTPIRVDSRNNVQAPLRPSRQGRKFRGSVFNIENNHRNNQNSRRQEFTKSLRQRERKGRTHLGPDYPHPEPTESEQVKPLDQHLRELQRVLRLQQAQSIQQPQPQLPQQRPQQLFQQPQQQLFQQPQPSYQQPINVNNAHALALQKHQENIEANLVQQQLHQLPQHQQLVQQQQLLQQQPRNHFQPTHETNAAHHQALQQHLQGVAKVLSQQQQQQQNPQHHVQQPVYVQQPSSQFAIPGFNQHQQYTAQLQAAQQALLSLG